MQWSTVFLNKSVRGLVRNLRFSIIEVNCHAVNGLIKLEVGNTSLLKEFLKFLRLLEEYAWELSCRRLKVPVLRNLCLNTLFLAQLEQFQQVIVISNFVYRGSGHSFDSVHQIFELKEEN